MLRVVTLLFCCVEFLCYSKNLYNKICTPANKRDEIYLASLSIMTEQNRTDYLFDVNNTVSSQSNTIIIYISRSQILLEN